MDFDLEVVFRNMPELSSVRKLLEKEIDKLDHKFQGIESCRCDVELPFHHRYPGNLYDIKVEIAVPGSRIVASRSPSADGGTADVFSLVRDIFDEIERKLDARTHASPDENLTYAAVHEKRPRRDEKQLYHKYPPRPHPEAKLTPQGV